MSNLITAKKYSEIKNEKFVGIFFDENGQRTLTYTTNILAISVQVMRMQFVEGNTPKLLIFTEKQVKELKIDVCQWKQDYYELFLTKENIPEIMRKIS